MKIEFDLTQDQIDTLKTFISIKYDKLSIDKDSYYSMLLLCNRKDDKDHYKNILEDIDKNLNILEIVLDALKDDMDRIIEISEEYDLYD